MMKFTWLFLINEIWINMLPNICSTKKTLFWLFNTVYRDTVKPWYFLRRLSYRENLIPLQPYLQLWLFLIIVTITVTLNLKILLWLYIL